MNKTELFESPAHGTAKLIAAAGVLLFAMSIGLIFIG
jgi:hypothetical protein